MRRTYRASVMAVVLCVAASGCIVESAYDDYCRKSSGCDAATGWDGGHLPDGGDGSGGDGGTNPEDGGSNEDGGVNDGGPKFDAGTLPRWGVPVQLPVKPEGGLSGTVGGALSADALTLCFGVELFETMEVEIRCVTRADTDKEFLLQSAEPLGKSSYMLGDLEITGPDEIFFSSSYESSSALVRLFRGEEQMWTKEHVPLLSFQSDQQMNSVDFSFVDNRLYYDFQNETGGSGTDLAVASRLDGGQFGPGTMIAEVNDTQSELSPAVSTRQDFLLVKYYDSSVSAYRWGVHLRDGTSWETTRREARFDNLPDGGAFPAGSIERFTVLPKDDLFFSAYVAGANRQFFIAPRVE